MHRSLQVVVSSALALFVAPVCNAASEGLEMQFRKDYEQLLRLQIPKEKLREEDLPKMINEVVGGLRIVAPALLIDDDKSGVPSEAELTTEFASLVKLLGADPPPVGMWIFYTQEWRANRLNPRQKIIFVRMIRGLSDEEARKRKKG